MFNVAYRRIINPDLPEPVRFLALLWAIESYCWLTAQKFEATYIRIGESIGFDWLQKPSDSQLVEAANLLRSERRAFLTKLETFTLQRRISTNAKGHNNSSANFVKFVELYFPDWSVNIYDIESFGRTFMTVVQSEIRAGAYYDSVVLMQLQKALAESAGGGRCRGGDGHPANLELLEASGDLLHRQKRQRQSG
jgi:hypothetical protein